MNLNDANIGETYVVEDIVTVDEDLKGFLFPWDATAGSLLL